MPPARTRRQNTRTALIKAADHLFEKLGAEETTLEQIAARAGLHVQTLYRHFPSKRELAAAIEQEYLDRFTLELETRDRSQHIFAFWRDWIDRSTRAVTRGGAERHRASLRKFLTNTTAPSGSSFLRISHQYEELLTREIAEAFGVDPEIDETPRLVACMLWAANVNAARRWAMSNTTRTLGEICLRVVDDVTALFEDRLKSNSKSGSRGSGRS